MCFLVISGQMWQRLKIMAITFRGAQDIELFDFWVIVEQIELLKKTVDLCHHVVGGINQA